MRIGLLAGIYTALKIESLYKDHYEKNPHHWRRWLSRFSPH